MNNPMAADLIKAIQIFDKYMTEDFGCFTNCTHDTLTVTVAYDDVTAEDRAELDKLGFNEDEYGCFKSFLFGSC